MKSRRCKMGPTFFIDARREGPRSFTIANDSCGVVVIHLASVPPPMPVSACRSAEKVIESRAGECAVLRTKGFRSARPLRRRRLILASRACYSISKRGLDETFPLDFAGTNWETTAPGGRMLLFPKRTGTDLVTGVAVFFVAPSLFSRAMRNLCFTVHWRQRGTACDKLSMSEATRLRARFVSPESPSAR